MLYSGDIVQGEINEVECTESQLDIFRGIRPTKWAQHLNKDQDISCWIESFRQPRCGRRVDEGGW
jgi:hypothetical protein